MKFLILLAFLTLAVTAFYQIPLKRFESPMAKMMKAGTWKDSITKQDAIRSVAHKTNRKYTQSVTDYEDVEYSAKITIGTPGQSFTVLLDTASSLLWVPDATCEDYVKRRPPLSSSRILQDQYEPRSKSANEENSDNRIQNGCYGKNKFNQTKSSTYVINGTDFTTSTGRITHRLWVFGFLGKDTIRFGESESESLVVPYVTFGQADFISSKFSYRPVDGVLGLAFPALFPQNIASPFFEAVKQGLVDKPVFSVYLASSGNEQKENGGVFTYGGHDDVNCGELIAFEELTSATYYQFKTQSFKYGTQSFTEGWQAIIDTSSAFIYAPYFAAQTIFEQTQAKFNYTSLCYVVDCEAKLPDIELEIGTDTYIIGSKNYITQIDDGVCCLRVLTNVGTAFTSEWILGYPFLWSYCTTFDVEKKQIGFALPKTK